jgi:hypothetical protein
MASRCAAHDGVEDAVRKLLDRQFDSQFPLGLLPTELRLKIWTCATEPRIVLLGDLIRTPRSYALPSVVQLNFESRYETRQGYEPAGRGSYLHFSRDILVCDYTITDQASDSALENLAANVERLAFYDCVPDDGRVDLPYDYSVYLSECYRQKDSGKIEFDRLWFPNLRELWIIKIGDVDPAWRIQFNHKAPYEQRIRQLAREFRYWVDYGIIEMSTLELDDAMTAAVLKQGRCRLEDCHALNHGRNKLISKVNFIDGEYQEPTDGKKWVRVVRADHPGQDDSVSATRMRWEIVERTLTFSLRWDDAGEGGEANRMRKTSA